LGKTITVAGQQFVVIGVMNKPATALPGQSDNQIFIPYFVMHKMYPASRDHTLMVKAREGQLAKAMDEARIALRQARRDGLADPIACCPLDQWWSSPPITAMVGC
jgi:hypothetical protein